MVPTGEVSEVDWYTQQIGDREETGQGQGE